MRRRSNSTMDSLGNALEPSSPQGQLSALANNGRQPLLSPWLPPPGLQLHMLHYTPTMLHQAGIQDAPDLSLTCRRSSWVPVRSPELVGPAGVLIVA